MQFRNERFLNFESEFDIARTLGAYTLRKPFEREEMLNAIKQLDA